MLKRLFDMCLSGFGNLISSPLWVLIALALVIEDGLPVFYGQERVGRHGRIFRAMKFRSMIKDAEKETGPVQAAEDDPRITKVGKILRNTAMDELPQLINIFKGDMSFVGPRSLRPKERDVHGNPNAFIEALGSPMKFNSVTIDQPGKAVSLMLHGAWLAGVPTIEHWDVLTLIGTNPIVSMNGGLGMNPARQLHQARQRGMKLVVIDPRCSAEASKAYRWIPIRPGTDGALALALANVIIKEGLYDRTFVTNWTVGFSNFSALVANKTPAWAAPITGISATTITTVARELARTKPAVVDVWSGPGHHMNGAEGSRAIASLSGLIGQVDAPGTLILPERKGPKFTLPPAPSPIPPRVGRQGDQVSVCARFWHLCGGAGRYD